MRITTTHINLSYLRLMADDDEDMILTMLGMLIEELPSEFEKIKQFYQEKNWDELKKVTHKMKSTLAFVGNDDLTTANMEIESILKNEAEMERIGTLIKKMEEAMPHVMSEIKQMLN